MELRKIIEEGKGLAQGNDLPFNKNAIKNKRERWINKSIKYLETNYPDSILTSDFVEQSQKLEKDFNKMVSILQGLKDVEEEVGSLKE